MPFATAGDIQIHSQRMGAGPRLLFISGTGADPRLPPTALDAPSPTPLDLAP